MMSPAVSIKAGAHIQRQMRALSFRPIAGRTLRNRGSVSRPLSRPQAAASGTAAADTQPTGPLTLIQFSIPLQVQFQEEVCVTGGAASLGNWDAAGALTLKWSEGDHWVGECELPRGGTVEYKYVIRTLENGVIWQEGDANLSVTVPSRALHIFVQDNWDMTEHTATVLDAEKVDWKRLPLSVEELEHITRAEEGLDDTGAPISAAYIADDGAEAPAEDTYAQGYQEQEQYYVPGLDPAMSSGEFYTDGMGDVVAWDPAVEVEYNAAGAPEAYYQEGDSTAEQLVDDEQDGAQYELNEAEPAEAMYAGELETSAADGQQQYIADGQEQYYADGQDQYIADGQEQYVADGQYAAAADSGTMYDPESGEYLPNQFDYSHPVYNSYEDPDNFGIEASVVYEVEGGIYVPDSDEYAPKPEYSQAPAATDSTPYYQAFNFEQTQFSSSADVTEEHQGPSSALPTAAAPTSEGEISFPLETKEQGASDVAKVNAVPSLTVDNSLADVKVDATGDTTFVFTQPATEAAARVQERNEPLDELPPFVLRSQTDRRSAVQPSTFETAVAGADAAPVQFPEEQALQGEEDEPVSLESLTYGELQRMCRARGLNFYGRKAQLLKRLQESQAMA